MQKPLQEVLVKDIMSSDILAARSNDKVSALATVMIQKDYSGIPIVDSRQQLVGMVTMKELVDSKGQYIPAAIQLLSHLHLSHRGDEPELQRQLKVYENLTAEEVMDKHPLTISQDASLQNIIEAFVLRNDELFAVVGEQNRLLGVVSKYDVLKYFCDNVRPLRRQPDMTIESYKNVLDTLEDKFVIISRQRTRYWLVASVLFLAVGFAIAFMLVLRINF